MPLKDSDEEKRTVEAADKIKSCTFGEPTAGTVSNTADLKRKRQDALTPSPDEIRGIKPDGKKPKEEREL